MRFSNVGCIAALAASAIAVPTGSPLAKRVAVSIAMIYNDISISGCVAGNDEKEAIAVLTANGSVGNIANGAEMDACNLAVESAATSHEKVSLQNGKTINKILK
ncbi:hypothetical protein B2J93_5997 [Marssonina coronariae]|uniref:Uncharacterized protein n=1 Tax=Diplocarpon coronariae TaxID=2795749 RepID=A0A218Z9J8_9HELO|nr:hypothetical protein B2J93_5997 [Marssonina coronariae]